MFGRKQNKKGIARRQVRVRKKKNIHTKVTKHHNKKVGVHKVHAKGHVYCKKGGSQYRIRQNGRLQANNPDTIRKKK